MSSQILEEEVDIDDTVTTCWICGEQGPQPEDEYYKVAGGCHEICWDRFELDGEVCT